MPQLNPLDWGPQLVWLLITFGALYLLMVYVALPRIGGVIEKRAAHIANDLAEADRLRRKTEEAIAAYEQALAEAVLADPAVASLSSFIGVDGVNTTLNSGRMLINLVPREQRTAGAAEVIRRHGITPHTFYRWKAKFAGMEVSDAKRLKALEDENAKLKKLLAETTNSTS